MATVDGILTVARSQIGYKEGTRNATKYGAAYGLDNQPWCMMFVWWCFREAGASGLITKTASCTQLREWGKTKGLYTAGRSGIRAGDIVLYNFDSDSYSDHVGIVESASASSIVAIEGNTSGGTSGSQSNGDGVYRRTRYNSVIQGYIRPKYEGAASTTTSAAGTAAELQAALNAQYGAGLAVDGIIGDLSRAAMRAFLTSKGSRGEAVRWIQARLIAKGLSCGSAGIDGIFGSDTKAAVIAFQKAKGFEVDGIVGIETYTALL